MNREMNEMMQVSYESDGVTRLNGKPLRKHGKSDHSGIPSFLRRVLMAFAFVVLMVAALFTKSFLPNDPNAAYVPTVGGGANTDDSDGIGANTGDGDGAYISSLEEVWDMEMENRQTHVTYSSGDTGDVHGATGWVSNF